MKKILFTILFLNLAACATKVVGLRTSPTFTGQSLVSEGISILGVVNSQGNLSESEKLELGNELKAQILERKPEIKQVISYGGVRQILGEKQHDKILNEITKYNTLSVESKKTLEALKIPTRYFAFVMIENDKTEKSRSDFQDTDSYGVVSVEKTKIRSHIRRSTTSNFYVFDLTQGNVVWSGVIEKSVNDSKEYTKDKDPNLVQLVKAIKGSNQEQDPDKAYPYPQTPELRKVMSLSFAGFAENLPKIE